jgi:hypothetical protein
MPMERGSGYKSNFSIRSSAIMVRDIENSFSLEAEVYNAPSNYMLVKQCFGEGAAPGGLLR